MDPASFCIYGLGDLSVEIAQQLSSNNTSCLLVADDIQQTFFKGWPVVDSGHIPDHVATIVVVCRQERFKLIRAEILERLKKPKDIQHFYPKALRGPEGSAPSLDWLRARRLIKRSDLVSFDVFGTLIIRNLFRDDAPYRIVDAALSSRGERGFLEARKSSEGSFVFDDPKGLTIRGYYSRIMREEPRFRRALRTIPSEYEIDRRFWSVSQDNIDLLMYALKIGKKVILLSDTFYTEAQISSYLAQVIPKTVRIFTSSKLGRSKASGDAFTYLRKKYCGKLVHIGDSWHADVVSARRSGFSTIHVQNPTDSTFYPDSEKVKALRRNTIDEYVLSTLYRQRQRSKNSYALHSEKELATVMFSPVLFNFCNWLELRIKEERIDNLLFCAREGYFLQRLFNVYVKLKGEQRLLKKQSYLKCSRNIALLAGIQSRDDIYDVFRLHRYEGSLYNLLRHRFRLPARSLNETLQGVHLDSRVQAFDDYLVPFEDQILLEARRLRNNYGRYLKTLVKSPKERVAIVDQGVSGTVQKFIDSMVVNEVFGAYVCHFAHNPLKNRNFLGMLEGRKSSFLKVSHIFESVLTSPTGSYVWCNDRAQFITGTKFTNQRNFGFRQRVVEQVTSDFKLFVSQQKIERPNQDFWVNPQIIERVFEGIAAGEIVFGDAISDALYFDNELVRPLSEHKIK
jgi:FMN phosphatase YigB (HAD superfamily)